MKKKLSYFIYALTILCWLAIHTNAVVAQNALTTFHDVIILKDGTIIRAKVLEIGIQEVKYKRGDQIDGPVYNIYRAEIYAISYGDNTQDYILPPDSTTFYDPFNPDAPKEEMNTHPSYFKKLMGTSSQATFGLGFFEQYSNMKNIEGNFERKGRLAPAIFLGYQVAFKDNLYLGIQLGFAWYKFSGGEYIPYDELLKDNEAKESIMSLGIYGKYVVGTGVFKPYLSGGLSWNGSFIENKQEISLLDDDQTILVNSKFRYSGLGLILRLGGQYQLNQRMSLYGDVGAGVSTLQIGTVFQVK
jgi:hypothetical protein